MEDQSATTRNILSILGSTPVIVLKRDPSGRKSYDLVVKELKELAGERFSTFEGPEGLAIIASGASRQFLL